jgi:hypothetical protein
MAALTELLPQIKAAVGAVGKGERNAQQGFNFRGIDAVINAVAPVLIDHGVTIVPNVRDYQYGEVEVGKSRTKQGHARVIVEYTFIGPEGDTITCSAPGEAMDSGDKATAKAMSVAYRTALLQALSLPTTEPDPDAVTYQRTDTAALNAAVTRVQAAWVASHEGPLDFPALASHFAQEHEGADIRSADVDTLNAYAESLGAAPPPSVQDHLTRATAQPEGAQS